MKMVSIKPHLYAGKRLVVGEQFDVRGRSDERLLVALGRAERAPVVVPPPAVIPVVPERTAYRTRAVVAEVPAEPFPTAADPAADAAAPTERPKRNYSRRDLTAE